MFNIFGDNRMVGPAGENGKDAFNLIKWAPHGIRRLFRESESVYIYFNTIKDGVIFEKGKPVALNNRGLGKNAKFLGTVFPKIREIKHTGHYMLELKDSIFEIKSTYTATTGPSTAIIAFSFKALDISEQPRVLFSNNTGTRSVSVIDRHVRGRLVGVLKIQSSEVEKEIYFDRQEWAGLIIQYVCLQNSVQCTYMLNDSIGQLDIAKPGTEESDILYIGGKKENAPAHHSIGSFELYYAMGEGFTLSDQMRKCLMDDIMDRVDEGV